MTSFKVQVSQNAITDLKARLALTRWPDREVVETKDQGVQLETVRHLIDHLQYRHDWRRFEERINRHPQFHMEIDGLDIHFIHVRSPHAGALPVILTHGWPGSVMEFLDTIGPLIDPEAHGGNAADAFDLVIPSIPGYGFSQRPTVAGWNADRTARAWGVLMRRLGYTHWVAQGGDWGSLITHRFARQALQPRM